MNRLEKIYKEKIAPEMIKKFKYSSIMAVPKITKITLNMGVGEAVDNKKAMTNAVSELTQISGQKPVVTKARKSIAGFKIREGWPIGCKVTLRKTRMYEFLDKVISIVMPRSRDFRGLSTKSFDGTGNYSFGVKEQIIFPEIDFDKIEGIRGLDVSITTSAKSDEEAKFLLELFRFPFMTLNKKKGD